MRYLSGVYWHCGSVASKNQDSVLLQQALTWRGRAFFAAVCDGMGGASLGEVASGYVAEGLQEWFYGEFLYMIRKKKRFWVIRRSLDRLVFHMQQQMKRYGAAKEASLGATMTACAIWERTFFVWHLGDSRAYRLRGSKARQLTTDHVQGAGQLTKCLGSFGNFKPQHFMGVLRPGEGVLLCSDGFYRQTREGELGDVLDPGQLEEEGQIARRLKEIGEACMKRGERDNLSAVYVKVMK